MMLLRTQVKGGPSGSFNPPLTSEEAWPFHLVRYLPGLFQTNGPGPLVSFGEASQTARVEAAFKDGSVVESVAFEIDKLSQGVRLAGGQEAEEVALTAVSPVFIPAKELLTLSYLANIDTEFSAPIDPTFLHLLAQLRKLPRKHPTLPAVLEALFRELRGEVVFENEDYYLKRADGQMIVMNMVAEGLRKFGSLQKLLANGSLTPQTTLFWDEPEANLNPALLRGLARVLAELARQGFQIILATHSMSLLKQFHILSREPHELALPIRYFGLNADPGEDTTVVTVKDFELLPHVVALEVELEQADALEEIFAREDRLPNADNH